MRGFCLKSPLFKLLSPNQLNLLASQARIVFFVCSFWPKAFRVEDFMRMRSFLVLLALLVTGSLIAGPAEALTRAQTRDVQEKLVLLGYEPGKIDGVFGRNTRRAVRAFQKDAQIRTDGVVGPQTLTALEEFVARGGPLSRSPAANNQLDIYEDVLTDRLSSGTVTLPSRFAKVEVSRAGAGRYSIAINGQVVSTSPGGNGLPRISRTFQMPGEDAIVFAAASGNAACRLEHTVIVVRNDGSFLPPTPIGNCKEVLNGRVQDDELVLSFPPVSVPSWRIEESWVYQYGKVEKR